MRHLCFFVVLLAATLTAHRSTANNIRQISSRNGLSNSAVIWLFQDSERFLWIGTYDGLNRYNGVDIHIYKPNVRDRYSLSGNVIRMIVESKDDYLWIMTKGGLNKYSKKRDRVEACFGEFPEDCSMACDSHGNFFILTQPGRLFYYDFEEETFRETAVPDLGRTRDWINLRIDAHDTIWITNEGVIRRYAADLSDPKAIRLQWLGRFDHPHPITHVFCDKGTMVIADARDDLFVVRGDEKRFIRNIRSVLREYGDISSVVFDGGDIILGLRTSGVVRLDHRKGYAVEKLPINCGVFSLLKDDVQDILWIGTDGQGVYASTQEAYTFEGINLEELPLKTQRPIRAIFSDDHGDLWLGTKGNGIIRIRDYANATEYNWRNVDHMTIDEGLGNSSVFKFTMSRENNLLWIGSGGPGIHYYSFDDRKIHRLERKDRNPVTFVEVHAMLETSPTTLWVSSLFSLLRVGIAKTGTTVETTSVERFDFDVRDKQRFNKIYAICPENDSIMWLAMRGNGAIRFNRLDGSYRLVTFDENGIAPMNDILSIHKDQNGDLWFGSSYGINKITEPDDGNRRFRNYNENDGLANNTIHGILESRNGDMWFSSNTGLILFDRAKNAFRNFNQDTGLKVIEFSDNAYYNDSDASRYFFGGIDGVVWITPEERVKEYFVPPIRFSDLHILNKKANIDDFFVQRKGEKTLQLKHNQNFFTVSFFVNDFLEGAGKKFSYILENFNEVWMNTSIREAQFTNIPPGRYVLKVRYGNEFEQESQAASLPIVILPPWYLSVCAKIFYALSAIGLLWLLFFYITRRYERKREQMAREMSRKYKEDVYENKLRFFTNITHEFCTPLSLIQTPSERIINYDGSDDFIRKYAHIIQSNSERLNTLIQEIIDFRRIETGNKVIKIERCDLAAVCGEIADAFTDLAEEHHIDFRFDFGNASIWNSDRSCLTTILNNLVSNAFKYTHPNGSIRIAFREEDDGLAFEVYNTGKGIGQDDIPHVFSRYTVLDTVGQNPFKGLSSRNGLGLSICKGMVELLGGRIAIESRVDEYARFVVKLPSLELPKQPNSHPEPEIRESSAAADTERVSDTPEVGHAGSNGDPVSAGDDRPKILIVDDNEDIRWMLSEIFAEDYTVYTARNGVEGLACMTNHMPDIVLTDVMMPDQDGIAMTRRMKHDPHTMHIPIIIISAKSAVDDKIEGVESGADAYVTKPFEVKYLKTLVRQFIQRHAKLREYYNSSASSFDYLEGRLLPKEDRDFIQSAIGIIDRNISDIDFSPEDLADNLSVSMRSLYRKFKELGLLPPKDFIKKQRIEYSAKSLLTTNLTIQEIMYNAGFTTRSHFYKEFIKRYNQSPKEYRKERSEILDVND